MAAMQIIPAGLAIEGIGGDARAAFEVAANNGYRGIAFATNHAELNPEALGDSARRHLKSILGTKGLGIEALRATAPRGGLTEAASIDRTMDNARRAMALARELGVMTVAIHAGRLSETPGGAGDVPEATVISALRQLAQQADAGGLMLAIGAEGATHVLQRILKAVDFERARANLETARIIGAGENPVEVAELLGDTVGEVTLADAVRAGKVLRAEMLGEGQLRVAAFLRMLEAQGFHGPMVVDVRDVGRRGAERAAAVLRGHWQ